MKDLFEFLHVEGCLLYTSPSPRDQLQSRKTGAFLQHGEIQTNPSKDLWFKLFKEEAPPKINLDLTNEEIVQHLRNSFLKDKSNIKFKNITIDKNILKNFHYTRP